MANSIRGYINLIDEEEFDEDELVQQAVEESLSSIAIVSYSYMQLHNTVGERALPRQLQTIIT